MPSLCRPALRACLAAVLLVCLADHAPGQLGAARFASFFRQAAPPPSGTQTTTWSFDETSTGQDISWTSPTNVDPDSPIYRVQFVFEQVDVGVSFLGFPVGTFDATDQIPPEMLMSTGTVQGPAPIALLDQPIVAPPPPEPVAIATNLSVLLDTNGFASVIAADMVLGTVLVDVPPFGMVNATITSIRIVGSVSITPIIAEPMPL